MTTHQLLGIRILFAGAISMVLGAAIWLCGRDDVSGAGVPGEVLHDGAELEGLSHLCLVGRGTGCFECGVGVVVRRER